MAKIAPDDRLYSEEHEWAMIDGSRAKIGISDHAQCSLGDVVYVELPSVDTEINRGAPIGVVESVKAVSDIYAPISGIVKAVNQDVINNPELVNQDPYQQAWMIEVELSNPKEAEQLMNATAYQEFLARESK